MPLAGWRARPSVRHVKRTIAGAGLPVSSETTVSFSRPGAGVVISRGRRTAGWPARRNSMPSVVRPKGRRSSPATA